MDGGGTILPRRRVDGALVTAAPKRLRRIGSADWATRVHAIVVGIVSNVMMSGAHGTAPHRGRRRAAGCERRRRAGAWPLQTSRSRAQARGGSSCSPRCRHPPHRRARRAPKGPGGRTREPPSRPSSSPRNACDTFVGFRTEASTAGLRSDSMRSRLVEDAAVPSAPRPSFLFTDMRGSPQHVRRPGAMAGNWPLMTTWERRDHPRGAPCSATGDGVCAVFPDGDAGRRRHRGRGDG